MLYFILFITITRAVNNCSMNSTISGIIDINNRYDNYIKLNTAIRTNINIIGTIISNNEYTRFSITICSYYNKKCMGTCGFDISAYVPKAGCRVEILHNYEEYIKFTYNMSYYQAWCIPDSVKLTASVFIVVIMIILCVIIMCPANYVRKLCYRREYISINNI